MLSSRRFNCSRSDLRVFARLNSFRWIGWHRFSSKTAKHFQVLYAIVCYWLLKVQTEKHGKTLKNHVSTARKLKKWLPQTMWVTGPFSSVFHCSCSRWMASCCRRSISMLHLIWAFRVRVERGRKGNCSKRRNRLESTLCSPEWYRHQNYLNRWQVREVRAMPCMRICEYCKVHWFCKNPVVRIHSVSKLCAWI